MKALFICDNKEEWNLIQNIFHAHFPKVEIICAIKSTDGLEYLSFEGPFALILIECSMKEDHPSQLAEQIFDQAGERPVIFIGTDAMIKDRVDENFFMQHEMVHIYKKPYDALALKDIIQKSIDWAKNEEFENSVIDVERENFLPMKLRNFYLFDKVPFDAFIELTRTKFIKAISKNKTYTQSAIQDIQRRNIKVLYLEKTEHLEFLESSIKKIIATLTKKGIPVKLTIQTQIAGALVIHQYLRDVGISETVISLVELMIESISKTYFQIGDLLTLLNNFPFENGDYAEQSILKAYLCESITRGMEWRSDLSKRKLGLTSLLHDCVLEDEIYMRITGRDTTEFEMLDEEQQKIFLEHPIKASELAQHFSGFTDVEFVIQQHHEQPDGSGFPKGLNCNKITTISCVFILASNFVTQLSIHGISKINIKNIMNSYYHHYNQGNFKEPVKVLKKLLKN